MKDFIEHVRESTVSDFYRAAWGGEREFERLPTVSRADFVRTPLSGRRYKHEKGLVKIVRDEAGPFLSEWSFADIAREAYGLRSQRPMVYMGDPHEAIEKSMWCYEQNMLPLIGEKDPDIAMYAAEKYQIDSLISDAPALLKLLPYLKKRTAPLASLSIIGSQFSPAELQHFQPYATHMRLVLALPEVGAFAEATYEPRPRFRALPGCVIERKETLVVTKERFLVTPIIRYRTDIPASLYDGA